MRCCFRTGRMIQVVRWFWSNLAVPRHHKWVKNLTSRELPGKARGHRVRPLLLATLLASTLLDGPAPAELLHQAQNKSAVRSLAEQAQARMLRTIPGGELVEFLNGLNTHDRLRHQLLPVVTLLTTRTIGDYQAMPFPKSLWGIYYLTRPFRLAGKAALRPSSHPS
jgi:hypothetical protein